MTKTRIDKPAMMTAVVAALILAAAMGLAEDRRRAVAGIAPRKGDHVAEVRDLLSNLEVDEARTHKNMIVFPIRWSGKQAPGRWETLDEAVAAGRLQITEKEEARVPQVWMANTGNNAVFLMSGEIVKGGKQTRIIRSDTIIEAKQKVLVPVLCVERNRWRGGKEFKRSANMAPSSIRDSINRGAGQAAVWEGVRRTNRAMGAKSKTESLDEALDSSSVKKAHRAAHKDLGKFSSRSTVGIAVADCRTGRVVGLELFGRRDLFVSLQAKLIEGYTTDLVIAAGRWDKRGGRKVTEKDVKAFIRQALNGSSKYEDTSGSGRGIDLVSGRLRGKGVALGRCAIHLSIQQARAVKPLPVRPIIEPRPMPARPIINRRR